MNEIHQLKSGFRLFRLSYLACLFGLLTAAGPAYAQAPPRIVSLDGTVSEILCDLGLQARLVGVDVTSTYPESLQKLPKVGHNRNISAEGVLAQKPTLVLTTEKAGTKAEVLDQLRAAGVQVITFKQEFSIDGTKKLITDIATACRVPSKARAVVRRLESDVAKVQKAAGRPRVLFIYARGVGTMFAAGRGTPAEKMIELAGGKNATPQFDDFKPLTTEALVAANPDVILLFDSGLESLGGADGLLNVPGVAQTNAGKAKRFVTMDGHLLTGFTPRLGKAIDELARKLSPLSTL
ncbi:heme/hemin ABC transporter substrate-binding protein [Spirosoma utsteinense]|uniref:Iron complex transport system substrate-binding protein n=1 Tax=Spirosoma utsteinense TaxID=2585773 RepID=A0ABR6W8H3_9BACT|nr:ABC transporter substrate-binding protein [Spirosoma utsteinense]MBC3787194.1 iron complex transport system substrate-binding protein [Spirosoma utsteinense]MBC3792879.1 iron complex transport system substrate-binding protein [Spirosoma utsteinense]